MECIIDLRCLGLENREHDVAYACSDFIIYKHKGKIYCDDCSGKTIASIDCPFETQSIQHCTSGKDIVLMIAGKEAIIKTGNTLSHQHIPFQRTGIVVTQLVSPKTNQIVFGSVLRGRIQFVNYDYKSQIRIAQTASWAMEDITDFNWSNNHFFVVLDRSYVIACKYDTCEAEWQRLEPGQINGKVLPYEDRIIYACERNLKVVDQKGNAETIKIPLIKIHHIEYIIGDLLYFTCQEGKHLCCYDLRKKHIVWEIPGTLSIHESLSIKGRDDTGVYDVLILRLDNHIAIVNLNKGKSLYYIKISGVNRIRCTGDHILIHKVGGYTTLLPGGSV